ncbi:bifunctional DNA-formamidopyrimidine glycosylase/DNA-(apurinic or apyrimidinic site) lyase [Saccharopolyspora sp. HNM0983]|uniref:Formamidopyrimidine-DNA glycosylase n=1 Tax=Saccharopolyspora montiporae TaxID=2781240 RepID=A0A929FX84_9PSEU|nr:bifunctional DNA-formamidopyrimidine glycosylase/DNA-(apurinic or apyrimidinic site) lyase [Saccharopolyspora sp. HNM0983]
MPELPEVEVVRRGVAEHAVGRTVSGAEVLHPRAVRRHLPGPRDFTARLAGREVTAVRRRGKYLWLVLDRSEAVVTHLGMSGQLLFQPAGAPDEKHLRVRVRFTDDGPQLRFVDQRTFGGLHLAELVETGGGHVPQPIAHIAPDPMDPGFDVADLVARIRRRRTGIKRALLDQGLVSGIGNIYADEALWRARLHWAEPTAELPAERIRELLAEVTAVMRDALDAGGTSFDALYVNVNGESGYFDRSLAVYGKADGACPRCGAAVRRDPFMNRSAYSCPVCQPQPRS